MMVIYFCLSRNVLCSTQPECNTSKYSLCVGTRERGQRADARAIEMLGESLLEFETGCFVRFLVISLRINKKTDYNFFARRASADCTGMYQLRTTWLVAFPKHERPNEHPHPLGINLAHIHADVDFGNGSLTAVALYLRDAHSMWSRDWALTGAFCINHGYCDALWRLRQGKAWSTQAGVFGPSWS